MPVLATRGAGCVRTSAAGRPSASARGPTVLSGGDSRSGDCLIRPWMRPARVSRLKAGEVDVAIRYGKGPFLGAATTALKRDAFSAT